MAEAQTYFSMEIMLHINDRSKRSTFKEFVAIASGELDLWQLYSEWELLLIYLNPIWC
jgi:hypothetical protein